MTPVRSSRFVARMERRGMVFVAVLLACFSAVSSKENTEEFKITPGHEGRVEVGLDTPPIPDSTCTFKWDAVGATTEVLLPTP